jgi:hypothetical protein
MKIKRHMSAAMKHGLKLPGQILDLANWKLTLPVCTYNPPNPDEVKQPALKNYTSSFFEPVGDGSGVVFRAIAAGTPTVGSEYARTELREMDGGGRRLASWSCSQGSHRLFARQSIDQLPTGRPAVVAGQIHGTTEYGLLVRLDGSQLYVRTAEGAMGDLDPNYQLGTVFDLQLTASNNTVRAYYNGSLKVEFRRNWQTCYFKAGVYLQSNVRRWGDSGGSYGQVTIYDLQVEHSVTG